MRNLENGITCRKLSVSMSNSDLQCLDELIDHYKKKYHLNFSRSSVIAYCVNRTWLEALHNTTFGVI